MASFNYMLRELEAEHIDQFYRIERVSAAVLAAASTLALSSGSVELLQVWLRNTGQTQDIPLVRVSRDQYNAIADKTTTGTPTLYYINHESLNAPVLTFWPVAEANITIYYDRMRFIQDATALSQTPDAHRLLYDMLAYGIGFRLAEKYNVEREGALKARFDETRAGVKAALVTRGNVMIYGKMGSRNRWRRA
jgi:hypothetical protein